MTDDLRTWIRSGDGPVPHVVRAARRGVERVRARAAHGSVPAAMDAVIGSVPAFDPRPASAPGVPRRVVHVSTYPLFPRQTGGQLRGWHLAEALTHDDETTVSIVSLTTDPSRAGHHELSPRLTETCVLLTPDHSAREARLRLLTGDVAITDIAAGVLWAGDRDFVSALERELSGATAAVLVQPYLADAVHAVAAGLPVVCDEHNDELSLKQSLYPANAGGRWLLDAVDRTERTAVEGAALVTATTTVDLDTLAHRYRLGATAVVPNGVDTSEIPFVTGDDRRRRSHAVAGRLGVRPDRPTALFIGSGHLPNIVAGRAIIEAAHALPDVEIILAGRHSEFLDAHHPPNVRLLGRVSDELLDLLLAGCDVALNPMDTGGGSNLKLLAYLAAGLPVVSTPLGARGVDAEAAGVHLVGLDGLAAGVTELIGANHEELSRAGRRYVEEHCDWRAIGRQFADLTAEHTYAR